MPRSNPGETFAFPADHALHPEFQTEWWYVTTNLQGEDGKQYGAQFTLFSNAIDIAGTPQRIFFAHVAVSSQNQFFHAERYARADMGHAGVTEAPFNAFIDHWQFKGNSRSLLPGILTVDEPDFGYHLKLSASPYFKVGEQGFSRKNSDGSEASYYYNAPFITIEGTIRLADKTIKVSGEAWLDREFSSGMFFADTFASKPGNNKTGWDWLSLHLNENTALMLYRVRGKKETYLSGELFYKDGRQQPLDADEIKWQPVAYQTFGESRYPVGWSVQIPSQSIDIQVSPINPKQLMNGTIPYWEGAMTVTGSHPGWGYLELFGY